LRNRIVEKEYIENCRDWFYNSDLEIGYINHNPEAMRLYVLYL
jgi:hypothetical protein